jgi:hypothetical protein
MSDQRYAIRWDTGDLERHLTRAGVLSILAELGCRWEGPDVLDGNGSKVGTVLREGEF